MPDRHTKIIEVVNINKRIEVSKLSELLKVSQVTIRKDLDLLEQKGILHREHGYAVISSTDDVGCRLSFNYDIKKKIAQLASSLVSNGETVMIESGACCALLAEELSYNKRDVTIITNSVFIADYIRKAPFGKVVLLGGDYQKESQVLVGPLTKKDAEDFFVDKLFLGTDGYNGKSGFTGKDLMRTEAVKAMAKNANKIIIITDSSKFFQQGVVTQFKGNEVNYLITDNNIPVEAVTALQQDGVEVKTVYGE